MTKLLQFAPRDPACTEEQLSDMLHGHFSLSQPLYNADTAIMESNRSVAEWKAKYLSTKISNRSVAEWKAQYPSTDISHYGSYAYDAGESNGLFLNNVLNELNERT